MLILQTTFWKGKIMNMYNAYLNITSAIKGACLRIMCLIISLCFFFNSLKIISSSLMGKLGIGPAHVWFMFGYTNGPGALPWEASASPLHRWTVIQVKRTGAAPGSVSIVFELGQYCLGNPEHHGLGKGYKSLRYFESERCSKDQPPSADPRSHARPECWPKAKLHINTLILLVFYLRCIFLVFCCCSIPAEAGSGAMIC